MIITGYAIGMIVGFVIYTYRNRKALEYTYSETIVTAVIASMIWPVYFISEIVSMIRWGR